MHFQQLYFQSVCVYPWSKLVTMVTAYIRCLVLSAKVDGRVYVGWILLFQPGSILHHYINTQCAMTSCLSGHWPGTLPHTVTRSTLDLQDRESTLYISRPGSISTFNIFLPSRRLLGLLLHIAPVTASGILTRIS